MNEPTVTYSAEDKAYIAEFMGVSVHGSSKFKALKELVVVISLYDEADLYGEKVLND